MPRNELQVNELPSRWLLLALAFGLGLVVGLVVLGWWLFPVQWRNAAPVDLARGYQADYLAMVAESYAQNRDLELARMRLEGFDPQHIEDAAEYLEEQQLMRQAALVRGLIQIAGQPGLATVTPVAPATPLEAAQPQRPPAASALGQRLRLAGGVLVLIVLLILGVVAGMAWLARRGVGEVPVGAVEEPGAEPSTGWVFHEVTLGYPATAGFVAGSASYKESFQIKDQFQQILGDCGLQVAEGLGPAPGDRVPALQVWLYDKEDGKTVSVTLLSEHAFRDRLMLAQFAGAGRVEEAKPQKVIHLETANLRLEVEILDVSYLEPVEDMPSKAYFARLDVQLIPTLREEGPAELQEQPM